MAGTQNSISSLVAQFLRLQKNSLEIINGLNEVATSTNDTVEIEMLDETGLPTNASIPAYGYLRRQIQRIDSNIQSLIGLGDNFATVRNPDGTYSQIYKVQPLREPVTLTNLPVPSTFSIKDNWFFESFLNPLLFVKIDVTDKIPNDSDRVVVIRIIANTTTDDQKAYFDNNLKGRNDIKYQDFITELDSQGIPYFSDEDVVDLPLRVIRNSGNFGVLAFYDDVVNVTDANGNQVTETRRNYKLNTLNYTDVLSGVDGGKTLDVNDDLITPDGTKYRITSVNRDETSVQLKRITGYAPVQIGSSSLSFSSSDYSPREIQVNIGFDERQAVFFKTIDDNFNIVGSEYSDGISFWSNELTINNQGSIQTLETFYLDQVSDMGRIFLGLAKENKITSIYGITPDAPTLDANNFKVVQVNKQLTDSVSAKSIIEKVAAKASLQNELRALEDSITKTRLQLNSGRSFSSRFVSGSQNNSATNSQAIQAKLNSLTEEKVQKQTLYTTLVEEISVTSLDTPQIIEKPKYRVRGFWDIPSPKYSDVTGNQNVIQFMIRYRYLSDSGSAQPTEDISYFSSDGQRKNGSYSNWNIIKTEVRQKVYDESKGTYVWSQQDTSDANQVNVNQLDIPITKGEQVEIQIASVSEAGYPENPLVSAYSPSVIVTFPSELPTNTIDYALMENTEDKAVLKIKSDLNSSGLTTHLSEQFSNGNVTYFHTGFGIASGFYDGSGNPISLFDKLTEITNELASLRAIVDNAKGILEVYITDGESDPIKVSRGDVIRLTAGFYNQIYDSPTTSDAGKIAAKVYNIQLMNAAASTLELASITPGGLDVQIPSTLSSVSGYNTNLRYGEVPVSITSLTNSDIVDPSGNPDNQSYRQASPFASGNSYSQYIYPRFKSVGYDKDLYFTHNNSYSGAYNYQGTVVGGVNYPRNGEALIPYAPTYTPPANGGTNASIWDGTFSGTTGSYLADGNGILSEFCIHKDHPDLTNGQIANSFQDLVKPDYDNNTLVYPYFRHANYFHLDTSTNDYYRQLSYQNVTTSFVSGGSGGSSSRTDSMYPDKLGFTQNDEYLVGRYTCGSYLFLAPKSSYDIQVEGSTSLSKKLLPFGSENSINIPLVFQFRCTDKLGYIGGFRASGSLNNITYTKRMGIDIQIRGEEIFSFDVEITGKYKNDTLVSPNFFRTRV